MARAASPISILKVFAELASTGQVFARGDVGYDDAHRLFVSVYDDVRPAVIAQVADASDIATVLSTPQETGLPLAIRSPSWRS